MLCSFLVGLLGASESVRPTRVETINPIHQNSFNKDGKAKKRRQGGTPHTDRGILIFEGSSDGDRQIDPQIAVGGEFVLEGTNGGLVIFDKQGNYVDGVPQSEFNNGIDPKLFFDPNNRVYGFDLWKYWDAEKIKPVNISVSESSDPRKAWNTYPVPAPKGVDGGGIGFSRRWIGYSFPGGPEETFVMKMDEVKRGKPAKVYHFAGSLGQPVFTQDRRDDLVFLALTPSDIVLRTVGGDENGEPVVKSVVRAPHHLKYFEYPPASPMKGVSVKTASGDRNPKNIVLQGGFLWFSQTVNVRGRAGILWHKVGLDGKFVRDGMLASDTRSYIQSTIAVNKHQDILVGFQETGPDMFVSARFGLISSRDRSWQLTPVPIEEGLAATAGGPWGDYSGSTVDGDNLVDLWTIQSFANAKGRGSTVIARARR